MSEGVSLKVQGDKRLVQAMTKLADPARKRSMLAAIGAYGVSSTQRRFETGTAPDGQKWKPSRRALKEGGKTLVKTPRLSVSLVYDADENSVGWGTNLIQARIHQFGGVIVPKVKKALAFKGADGFVLTQKVKMPARPYLGVNERDNERIGEIALGFMQGAFK